MKLSIVGSSSKGNGYVIHNEHEALIIEAGVRYKQVKQVLDWNVGKIAACIVSHSHADHAGFVGEYIKEGVKVYAPTTPEADNIRPGVINRPLKSDSNTVNGVQFRAGGFHILPFSLQHDVPCNGYLIHHQECGKVLFITDTHYSKYRFNGIDHFIVEANYSEAIIRHRLSVNEIDYAYYERVLRSHMSLETVIDLLEANNARQAKTITLIHLSDGNSDAAMFQKKVQGKFGVPVYVAEAGMEVELF